MQFNLINQHNPLPLQRIFQTGIGYCQPPGQISKQSKSTFFTVGQLQDIQYLFSFIYLHGIGSDRNMHIPVPIQHGLFHRPQRDILIGWILFLLLCLIELLLQKPFKQPGKCNLILNRLLKSTALFP